MNNQSMTHFDQEPVTQFFDLEAENLGNIGRAYVFESYGFNEKPIVIKCRKMGEGGQQHVGVFADVGSFTVKTETEIVKIPAKGRIHASTETAEKVSYVVSIRPFGSVHTFDGAEVERQFALDFACEYALACFGKSFNYMIDLKTQGRPTLAQTRDVLVKYGLVDASKLPKAAPKKVQTHGGRGSNAATVDEISNLTGALVGSA